MYTLIYQKIQMLGMGLVPLSNVRASEASERSRRLHAYESGAPKGRKLWCDISSHTK